MGLVRSERGVVDRVALATIIALAVFIGGGYAFLRLTASDDTATSKPTATHSPKAKPTHHVKPLSSPSPTPTEDPYDENTPDVGKVVVVSSDHDTTSDAPGIPYWADAGKGGALHAIDGSTTPLRNRPATFVQNLVDGAPREGDWAVLTTGSQPRFLWVDPSGSLQANLPSAPGGLIGSFDGKRYASLTQGGYEGGTSASSWVIDSYYPCSDYQDGCNKTSGADSEFSADPRSGGRIDGFLSNGQVLVEEKPGQLAVWDTLSGQAGHEFKAIAGNYAAAGSSSRTTDRYAVKSSNSCWGVTRYPKKPLAGWKTCYAAIGPFSEDGSKVVLTGDGYQFVDHGAADEPQGPGTLWIRKASDNSPVVVYTAPTGGFFTSWAWDGDVLDAVLYEPGASGKAGSWSLLRLGATSYQVQSGLQAIPASDRDSPAVVLPRG